MAFPATGNFDYLLGGRPLVTLAKDTGNFDYWLGGRAIEIGAATSVTNAAIAAAESRDAASASTRGRLPCGYCRDRDGRPRNGHGDQYVRQPRGGG